MIKRQTHESQGHSLDLLFPLLSDGSRLEHRQYSLTCCWHEMFYGSVFSLPQQRKLPIGRLIIPVKVHRSSRLAVFSQHAAGWDSVWCFSAGKDEHPGEVPDIPLCADDRRLRRPDCALLYQWSCELTWCRRWVWDLCCSLKHSLTWNWWQLFPDDPWFRRVVSVLSHHIVPDSRSRTTGSQEGHIWRLHY